MARPLSWSDVRGGLVACLVIAVLVVGILKFARVGALHGNTFRLYALVGEARGVTKGSEVWLNGQMIGKISGIHFRQPQTADTLHRIQIDMELLERYRSAMRRDAQAQIRPGGSIVGPPVVYLSPGTARAPPLQPGDTVVTRPQADAEGAASQFSMAAREFPVIIANVKVLAAQLQSTEGTIGAFLNGPGLEGLGTAQIRATRLTKRMSGGGSAGAIARSGLAARAQRVMARVDSVRTLLASSRSSLGRLRRDSTLVGEVADIRNELTLVRADLDQSRGTAGRAMNDSALANAISETERQMTLLFDDLTKHPFRYLSF